MFSCNRNTNENGTENFERNMIALCQLKSPCFKSSVLKTMQYTLKYSYHEIDIHNDYGLIACIWHDIKKLNDTSKTEIPVTFMKNWEKFKTNS